MKSEGSEIFTDLDPGHIGSNSWDLNWVFQLQSIHFSPLYHGLLQIGFEIKAIRGEWIKKVWKSDFGTFLVVQRFRIHLPRAGDLDSVLGWGTKIPFVSGQLSPCSASTESTCSRADELQGKIRHATVKIPSATTRTRCSQINKYEKKSDFSFIYGNGGPQKGVVEVSWFLYNLLTEPGFYPCVCDTAVLVVGTLKYFYLLFSC